MDFGGMGVIVRIWLFYAFFTSAIPLSFCLEFHETELESDEGLMEPYKRWMKHHHLFRTPEEMEWRVGVFKDSARLVLETNRNKNNTYSLGLNMFADRNVDELVRKHTGGSKGRRRTLDQHRCNCSEASIDTSAEIPDSIDWSAEGAVTPAKNQLGCGDCWLFAAMATVESLHKIREGHLTNFSEQYVIDCVPYAGRNMETCQTKGKPELGVCRMIGDTLIPMDAYPYTGTVDRSSCSDFKIFPKTRIDACNNTKYQITEGELRRYVARQPVAVAIYISPLHLYKGGIYNGTCSPSLYDLNHAAAIIGYGSEGDTAYWILKNSWGPEWGEQGKFRLHRGDDNNTEAICGITIDGAYFPFYATTKK